ncbi:hypothetical protein AALA52_06895 [Lactococcus ileimucosae]|uniref:DUF1310 family protein n=1 Tax=Lactococcus ileimucosae TaxID=2941329 RepID=A0ABV4D384_9LACT
MKKNKKGLVFSLLSVLMLVLILAIGGKVYMSNKENENIANQRTAALAFKEIHPEVEEIKFVEQGSRAGSGTWTVGVDVVINGKKYDEIFVKDGLMGGEPLPQSNKNVSTEKTTKVVYSNGKEEVLK